MNIPITPQLPFFVYGTLLPGQPNAHTWAGMVGTPAPATFDGGELYDMVQFPMLIEGDGPPVVGMLLPVLAEHYDRLLTALDTLEQYDPARPDESPYRRRARPVTDGAGSQVMAWVYLGRRRFVTTRPQILPADWATYSARKYAKLVTWWRQPPHARDLRDQLGKPDQNR